MNGAESILVSRIIDWAFTAAELGLNRQEVVDEARAMEEAGATPEEVMKSLHDKRKDAHAALGKALE